MKPPLLFLSALLLLAVSIRPAAAEVTQALKPTIVLIVADDLGYNDLGGYRAALVKTPRLDTPASEAVRFTDAHSVRGICISSRYFLLRGTNCLRQTLGYNRPL
ncbi:MAG: sulfatase-like hydrolase/transferase [Opitutaceae bacterium]